MRMNASGFLGTLIMGAALATGADAALTTMDHEFSVNNRSEIDLGDGADIDRAGGSAIWNSTVDGYNNAYSTTFIAGHSIDGLFTNIQSVSSLETDSTGFVHTSTMHLNAMNTLEHASVDGRGNVTHNAYMMFDEDTELEISLRVGYSSPTHAGRFVSFELSGLEGAALESYLLDDTTQGSGSFEIAFRATARANEFVTMYSQMQGFVDAGFGAGDADTGAFSLRTEIRVVPAPGFAGMLAAVGVIAGRRRRSC